MKDTEGRRYVVFHQEAADKPHRHAGSVHAPDAAMALMHARDVFVRRPECVGLWVAPADQVYSRTLEELKQGAGRQAGIGEQELVEYVVFVKSHHKGSFEHAGSVSGTGPAAALSKAVESYGGPLALAWWLLPVEAIHRSKAGEEEVWFGPARSKDFRRSTFFHTLSRKLALRGATLEEDSGS